MRADPPAGCVEHGQTMRRSPNAPLGYRQDRRRGKPDSGRERLGRDLGRNVYIIGSGRTGILSTKNGGGTGESYLSSNAGVGPETVERSLKRSLKADSVSTSRVSKDVRRIRLVYAGGYQPRIPARRD